MLDLPSGTGRRMKTWEKIAWPIYLAACGFVMGWGLYTFTH